MVDSIEDGDRTIPVIEHLLNFDGASSGFDTGQPTLGKDTFEVFEEVGYDGDPLERICEKDVFGGEYRRTD